MKPIALLVAGVAALTAANPVLASPAVNLTAPGLQYFGSQYTLGFEFSVATAQAIDALGVYDDAGDGLTANASIGLWDTVGNLLTSTTIAAGSGTLNGLFRYAAITPYQLTAGTRYVVGAYTTDLATSQGTGQGGAATINPLVTIYRDRFSDFNSTFSFPTRTEGRVGGSWLGGNFDLAAVPEPATWVAMSLGFGVAGLTMRRRRTIARLA